MKSRMKQPESRMKGMVWCIIALFVIAIAVGCLLYTNIETPTLERSHVRHDSTDLPSLRTSVWLSNTTLSYEATISNIRMKDELVTSRIYKVDNVTTVAKINTQSSTATHTLLLTDY